MHVPEALCRSAWQLLSDDEASLRAEALSELCTSWLRAFASMDSIQQALTLAGFVLCEIDADDESVTLIDSDATSTTALTTTHVLWRNDHTWEVLLNDRLSIDALDDES